MRFNLPTNKLFVIKASPIVWEIPDPTAPTTAIGVWQANIIPSTGNEHLVEKRVITQIDFHNDGGIENGLFFTTNEYTKDVYIVLRAMNGVPIKLNLYQLDGNSEKVFGNPPTNEIIYNTSTVKGEVLENAHGNTELAETQVKSAWAVVFPDSYKVIGKPTQVIAMLHGSIGYVTPSVLGYSANNWETWRNAYLEAGFAVLDINGWGISTSSDNKSHHWGCPLALETLDKAFSELRELYNINEKLLIHGTSMGGSAAWSYALTHPNKVAAVGLFAPATLSWIAFVNRGISGEHAKVVASWQYPNEQAAIDDNYQRMVGYDPYLKLLKFQNGIIKLDTQLVGLDVLSYATEQGMTLVGKTLGFPVRIWHGTADDTVPIVLNETLVQAFRNGGGDVTLRKCTGAGHDMCTGANEYVINESVDYFLSKA